MEMKSLTIELSVKQSPEEVFAAINDVRGWWSGDIDGATDRLGAEFEYRYKGLHRSRQKITELVPGKKVVWHVVDSDLSFVKERGEWNGTDIVFEIARRGRETRLRFTHVGLSRALECYGGCSDGWGFYIRESLRDLIATGKGQPNPDA